MLVPFGVKMEDCKPKSSYLLRNFIDTTSKINKWWDIHDLDIVTVPKIYTKNIGHNFIPEKKKQKIFLFVFIEATIFPYLIYGIRSIIL